MRHSRTRALVEILLVAGLVLWRIMPDWRWEWDTFFIAVVGVAALLGVLAVSTRVRRAIETLLRRARHPSLRTRLIAALLIAGLATTFLIATSLYYDRYLKPMWHDEFAYAIQTRMLAQGRLWMPAHPLGEFFETFYVLHQPRYAAIYFPGTALLYVWAIWLHVPLWIASASLAGVTIGLFYWVIGDLIDDVAGGLGAAILLSLTEFQRMAMAFMAQVPMLLLSLLMVWSFLRWRRHKRAQWALCIGVFAGWAAITRPLDAICYAAPIGLAMLWDLRGNPLRQRTASLASIIAGALPFLAVQLIFNLGVTGSVLTTPWHVYVDRDLPGAGLGFRAFDATLRPQSSLPEKQLFYKRFISPYLAHHDWMHAPAALLQRAMSVVQVALPHPALLPIALAGLAAFKRRRWIFPAAIFLFILFYGLYPFTLPHYTLIAAPAAIMLLLMGIRAIETSWLAGRRIVFMALATGVLIIALVNQSEARFQIEVYHRPADHRAVDHALASIPAPAVVLFRFSPHASEHFEPVYNIDVAWPDDAPIVRAHDLGERNIEIFRYYAARQPNREFYRFDLSDYTLRDLGSAKNLAQTP